MAPGSVKLCPRRPERWPESPRRALDNSRPSKGGRVFRLLRLPGWVRAQRSIVGVVAVVGDSPDTFSRSKSVGRRRGKVFPIECDEGYRMVGMSPSFCPETRKSLAKPTLIPPLVGDLVVLRHGGPRRCQAVSKEVSGGQGKPRAPERWPESPGRGLDHDFLVWPRKAAREEPLPYICLRFLGLIPGHPKEEGFFDY